MQSIGKVPTMKRIVLLLLVAAAIFVPEVRGDGVPTVNFTFSSSGGDTLFFTLPQNPGGLEFFQVPVFTSFMPPNTPLTYDVFFSREPGLPSFEMFCDPFIFSLTEPPFFHCDFIPRVDEVATPMWSGPDTNPTFIPGVYGDLTISATPEPSTLALLFVTLCLLGVGVRPRTRDVSRRHG
jgi:hypothetical protein